MDKGQQAEYARILKTNPLWDEVFEEMRLEIISTWEVAKMAEDREGCWKMLTILKVLKQKIESKLSSYETDMDALGVE